MIASLRGLLTLKEASQCVLEVGGVGYLVQVSTHTHAKLPDLGEPVFLHTHQVVREDAHMLFGFAELEERQVFELLITVSGIGPKVAIAVLSGLKPQALAKAIRNEDLASLTAISGVGRKTAERMVVDLRDKIGLLSLMPAGEVALAPRGAPIRSERAKDAVAALVRLGYSATQAQDAVRQVGDDETSSLEDLVRRSLAKLSKATVGAR